MCLKRAGALFRAHLTQCMQELGYELCKVDPDLWMKLERRPEDGFKYYSYILCYMHDILCIHHDKLNEYVPLKPSSVGSPDMYLGTKL